MRRVLAPLRRCFADDDRRTRLRALYEDATLVRGSDAAVIGETDPTTVIADRKIADAARRGVFDKLCLLYTSPSPRDQRGSRMPSSA